MNIPQTILDQFKAEADGVYPTGYTTSGNGFRNEAFPVGATFGFSLRDNEVAACKELIDELIPENKRLQSELAEKDKEIDRLKQELFVIEEIGITESDCAEQLAEANKEIDRLKELIEDTYIQGRNDQINNVENGWEQFKTENNLV